MPTERSREEQRSARQEVIIQYFEEFRQDIDDHNDRRDRLIKLNRDVTNLSKKVIFYLQRVATEENHCGKRSMASVVKPSHDKFSEIRSIFGQMGVDLQGENFWRYQKIISGGVQEYIEALAFAYFLENNTLVTYEHVQQDLTPFLPSGLFVTDYLLGVSDLSGELMRLAITFIARQGVMSRAGFDQATAICQFVRACKSDWEAMTPYIKELRSKQVVTANSLRKIEETAYSVAVRGFERARLEDVNWSMTSPFDGDNVDEEELDDPMASRHRSLT